MDSEVAGLYPFFLFDQDLKTFNLFVFFSEWFDQDSNLYFLMTFLISVTKFFSNGNILLSRLIQII